MKKIITLITVALALAACGTTHYTYYEVDSAEMATIISKQDAEWSLSHVTPSRVIAVYPDSTGHHMIYLIESKTHESLKEE